MNSKTLGDLQNARIIEGSQSTVLPTTNLLTGELGALEHYAIKDRTENKRIIYCHQGNALLIGKDHQTHFLAAGTATCIEPNEEWNLILGRGKHFWVICDWEVDNPAIPESRTDETNSYLVNNCSLVVRMLTERVLARIDEINEWPNFALAWFNMLIHERHFTERTFALTPTFRESADPIDDLIASIKENPQKAWNLTDAAKLASYSPFHLSRLFRSVANMGFPEFVDRCRTELAIDELISTKDQLNIISERCGFGTPQAMRNACREYTGFLPSELRTQAGE